MTNAEPFASRWKRRTRTIPLMLGATAAGVLASPLLLVVASVIDIGKRRFRLPTVRVALFLLQYGINDSVEILLSPFYWVAAGFGTRLDRPRSIARHQHLQAWSIRVMARRAERLLGLRFDIDPISASALTPGPVIVLCRHVNVVDASLPTLLYQRLGYRTRGVIMSELLADPGFDLIYSRTGSVFIPRDNGPEAIAMVHTMGRDVDAKTAVVIFPEGRLFRPDRLERTVSRLTLGDPERAARLSSLRHVLPPRPGGVLALIDALPRGRRRDRPPRTRAIRFVHHARQRRAAPQANRRHRMANPNGRDPHRRTRSHRLARQAMGPRRRIDRPSGTLLDPVSVVVTDNCPRPYRGDVPR